MTETLVVFWCFYAIYKEWKTPQDAALGWIAGIILFCGALFYGIPTVFAIFGFWSANATGTGVCSGNSTMDRIVFVVGIPALIAFMCWVMLSKKNP